MAKYNHGAHNVHDIKYHFVWVTKYRYKVLRGNVALRLRELLRQTCEKEGIAIVQGNISKDHVHMLLSCPPTLSPSKIMKLLKGRSSHLLQDEFPELKKRYWGQRLWARGYFCATVGAVTEDIIKQYIANQEKRDDKNFTIT